MRSIRIHLLASALAALSAASVLAQPGTIKFDEASFEVSESAGMAVITVERSQGEDGAVSIQYATANGTAVAGQDYTAVSGTLSWAPGDEGDKTFQVPIADDAAAEGAETIQLTLGNPTGGAAIDAERGTSVVVILANDGGSGGSGGGGGGGGDDDGGGAGVLKFDERDMVALEGSVATVSVERSNGETGAVSVRYATSDGTAKAGQDYTATSGTLTWAAGDGSHRVFNIPIRSDAVADGGETIHLTLSAATGGAAVSAERGTAVVRILESGQTDDNGGDDDSRPGTLKFTAQSFQVIEGTTVARIGVERSHGERGTVSVRYATGDASARAGQDYTAVSGTLTWGPGDGGTKLFEVPVREDSTAEGNEALLLTLSDATGGATVDAERGRVSLAILDNDGATAACGDDDDTLCLLGNRFKVEVVWRTGQGQTGRGHMLPISDASANIWFFSQDNIEMLVKMLDACSEFGNHWVFFAATTNVSFTVEVTDTATGIVKEYTNPFGNAAEPVQDTFTFPCS